jgi:CBS-domain-containing membrane protein
MLVERLLDKIRARLATLRDDAPLIEAARLLRVGTDIVVVCDSAGTLTGVITKGDVVRTDQYMPGSKVHHACLAGDDS